MSRPLTEDLTRLTDTQLTTWLRDFTDEELRRLGFERNPYGFLYHPAFPGWTPAHKDMSPRCLFEYLRDIGRYEGKCEAQQRILDALGIDR